MTLRSLSVDQIQAIDRKTWALAARVHGENHGSADVSFNPSVICPAKPEDAGGYLAYSTFGIKPLPPQSGEDGTLYLLAPGQQGSGGQFTPCKGARFRLALSGSFDSTQPDAAEWPIPGQLLMDLAKKIRAG